MERIEIETTYPQLVKVVNELIAKVQTSESEPLNVALPSALLSSLGDTIRVQEAGSMVGTVFVKPVGTNVNGCISCVHVVNSGVGYIFPVNQEIFNVSENSFTTAIVPSLWSSFQEKFPSATSIIVFYNYHKASRVYTFSSYSGD